ncbi:hypothetical protein COV24_02690 [candidate division WWE3 bacterium CG10_big_fil_rev_8_21_14_0_10_32_10]|uniref:SipW-cognate class signal peptide n=1 Tax=candidate division WWE3 bacterium CG10_big_fil_rev_8_21_14_0_10_32_10 TaxID=1975090 RepID=A0A2H0RBM0_UNCKA|nr:MAG: hypothetical protein COV24_02690 [candidate division WWE3 bacterium CG10_big_fil_rev_8_21_14_0_10_32_10]
MNVKKLLLSVVAVSAVSAAGILGTSAFFSDTETSTGNVLSAGSIDLKVDNHSYYNGILNENTTWDLRDLTVERFFDFTDLKPQDWGEDTISLHVTDNDSWVCANLALTENADNGLTEPEADEGDSTDGSWDGELGDALNFVFWVDDGDNVYETDETIVLEGKAAQLPQGDQNVGQSFTLADSNKNVFGEQGPLTGAETHYIGKYWCYGDITLNAANPQEQNTPTENTGFTCNGESVNNMSQSDSLRANLSFYAVQSRNNDRFTCDQWTPVEDNITVLSLENKVEDVWQIQEDSINGVLTFKHSNPTFDYNLNVNNLHPNTSYSLIYYADPWPGNHPGALLGTFTTDGSGNGSIVNGSVNLGLDLPDPADSNYPSGAKIWVVTSSDYNGSDSMTAWNPDDYLFEYNTVKYDDTDN